MELHLDDEQRSQLELISMYSGKTPEQVVSEAALFLLERDMSALPRLRSAEPGVCQAFLDAEELDARISKILRR